MPLQAKGVRATDETTVEQVLFRSSLQCQSSGATRGEGRYIMTRLRDDWVSRELGPRIKASLNRTTGELNLHDVHAGTESGGGFAILGPQSTLELLAFLLGNVQVQRIMRSMELKEANGTGSQGEGIFHLPPAAEEEGGTSDG
jgi:hypothetical protein